MAFWERNRCQEDRVSSVMVCWVAIAMWVAGASVSFAQKASSVAGAQAVQLPDAPGAATITGTVTDTDDAAISAAHITLEETQSKSARTVDAGGMGEFTFDSVAPGRYVIRITARGFASWKVEDVEVHVGEHVELPRIALGVEAIDASVNAISQEDLAEQQISVEEKQRILGILPNFYVSYVSHAQPLTRRQKFKLALRVSVDPLTYITTGATAGIEQAENDFSGYGPGFGGYAQRYAATYGDRLSSTMLGAALLPSLLQNATLDSATDLNSAPRIAASSSCAAVSCGQPLLCR